MELTFIYFASHPITLLSLDFDNELWILSHLASFLTVAMGFHSMDGLLVVLSFLNFRKSARSLALEG